MADPNDFWWSREGIFRTAVEEYENGYDVHMYNENTIGVGGASPAYDEIVSAINDRGVTRVILIGYSWGGGDVYQLAHRLARNLLPVEDPDRLNDIDFPFLVPFTSYVDAITTAFADSENRRPALAESHLNQYQTYQAWPQGGPMDVFLPNDRDVWVTNTVSGATLDHTSIDDDAIVLGRIKAEIENLQR